MSERLSECLVNSVQVMDDGTLAEGPPKTQEQCRIKVSSVFCFFLERQVCSLSVLEGFIIILLLAGRAAGFSQ